MIEERSLFEYPVIAHQCNCTTTYGKGLYSDIIARYPDADVYKTRDRVPGTISVNGGVIAMFAQYRPGKNRNGENREEWFRLCLAEISKLDIDSIAFPYGIGCGLAGGNWSTYFEMIRQFAISNPKIKVVIAKHKKISSAYFNSKERITA